MKKAVFSFAAVCFIFSQALFAVPVSDTEFLLQLNSIKSEPQETIKSPVEKEQAEIKPAKLLKFLPLGGGIYAVAKTQPAAPVQNFAKGEYVHVSGYVHLTGSGWVPGTNGGFTSVNLTGWANFRDSSGKVTSNNTYVNVMASIWIYPNQYVFQTVWPNIHVQFYKDGKYVGSTTMTGSISVSGWPTGNFVHLNGSGYLNGSLYINETN